MSLYTLAANDKENKFSKLAQYLDGFTLNHFIQIRDDPETEKMFLDLFPSDPVIRLRAKMFFHKYIKSLKFYDSDE